MRQPPTHPDTARREIHLYPANPRQRLQCLRDVIDA